MSTIPASLQGLAVPIDSVRPCPGNPRRGQIDAIKESLRVHGQYRPIVVQRNSSVCLAGNHTLAAARALGWSQIAVTFVECDDEEARRIVLADNRLSDLGTYDDAALTALLEDLATTPAKLVGTGYDDAALTDLLAAFQPEPNVPQGALDHRPTVTCPHCGGRFELIAS